jgi:hypothetical protein
MPAPILILAGVGILAGAALVTFAVLVAGIRRGDRAHLARAPRSHSDALARRILVGVRYPSDEKEEEDL